MNELAEKLKKIKILSPLANLMKKFTGSADYKNASPIMREVLVKTVNEDLSECAKKIKAETLLIWGDKDTAVKALNISIELDNNLYKKAMEDAVFIPIKGYIDYPNIDEEDIEQKQSKATEREILVRKHLEDTYKLVGKLNYKEIGVRYSNTKDKQIERQI